MDVGTLCQSCALCCNGALFGHVSVTEDEAARLKVLGLSTLKLPLNKPLFLQPCQALGDDCRCKIYEDRPSTCRSFNCLLATALMAGEVDLPEALRVVEEAKRQIVEQGRTLAEPYLREHFIGRAAAPK